MTTPKETILAALRNYRGDDLERAEMAFRHYNPKQLNEEYGQSGKTCLEILEGYSDHSREVDAALKLAETL